MHKKDWLLALLLLLPVLTILIIFRFIPIVYAFIISFHKWGITGPSKFVWFSNYIKIFNDAVFWRSLGNTFYYTIFSVPMNFIFSLCLALLLNQKVKALGIFRTIYFLPVVTSIIAVSIVFKWIYHPRMGLLNYILSLFHLPTQVWLEEARGIFEMIFGSRFPVKGPSLALMSLIFMSVWKSLGYNVVIFLAGLQNIPDYYYDASKIDGANRWQTFWNVTFPLLSPVSFYVLLITTITSFQVFASVWMMTGPPPGGPLGTTNVVVYYLFENAFTYLRYGYASALAFILFIIIMSFTIIQKNFTEKKVYYD